MVDHYEEPEDGAYQFHEVVRRAGDRVLDVLVVDHEFVVYCEIDFDSCVGHDGRRLCVKWRWPVFVGKSLEEGGWRMEY